MKKAFVTGAAGFIGSNLCDYLLASGWHVTGWDNLSTGRQEFLANALKQKHFELVIGDNVKNPDELKEAAKGADVIFHLAANADVKDGLKAPDRDLKQNTIATFNVLEAARTGGAHHFVFSSTGSVYGEATIIPTPEDHPFPIQTSLYGASKLAGEGLIAAYAEGYKIKGTVFRFVSVLGERYTHGHIVDFVRQLKHHPEYLDVLGNGMQRKSYMYVGDCVRGIMSGINAQESKFEVFNLGTAEAITVNDSIAIICKELGVNPKLNYSGGTRGWIGDNPNIELDISKIKLTGWTPTVSIDSAVRKTTKWLLNNPVI